MAIDIRVECYSGYRADERPRALTIGDRRVEVVDVVDRWLAPDFDYFKLRGDDGAVYIVRHDRAPNSTIDRWELVVWERA